MLKWLMMALAALAAGCAPMSESHLYRIAAAAVKEHEALPVGAEVGPRADAEFYLGKNAGCIHVSYVVPAMQGESDEGTYTVWLKRIGMRWEVDRLYRRNGQDAAGDSLEALAKPSAKQSGTGTCLRATRRQVLPVNHGRDLPAALRRRHGAHATRGFARASLTNGNLSKEDAV